jgi:hypothetical protein
MAKNLNFLIGKSSYSAGITKVDRDKVYGYVEELVLDKNGNLCSTGNLLDDGQTLILSGATALKTVTESNTEVDKKKLKTVYLDGSTALLIPSSYDTDIELQKADMDDLFNLEVNSVYQLSFEDDSIKTALLKALEGGIIYRFVFNYRADYEAADAILLGTQSDVFALTGRILSFEYLENKTDVSMVVESSDKEDQDDDTDFGML